MPFEVWSLKRTVVVSYVVLARVYQALGEHASAREWLNRAIAIVQPNNLKQTFSHWEAYRVRIYLAQGDTTVAAQSAHEIEPDLNGDLNRAREFHHITLARIYLAQNRPNDAQRLLSRLHAAALAAGRNGRLLEILLLQALAAHAQGKQSEAITTLEQELRLAEPEGYIRTVVDMGALMAALLKQIVRGNSPTATYAARLLETV